MYKLTVNPFNRPPVPVRPRKGPLANAPAFESMAELDAWIESCKDPKVDHDPVTVTEAEWKWHKRNR